MMEDKGGTMTTAANNPIKITLEDLEEKLESFIHVFNDDLCRTIIEYMIDSEGPFAITRHEKFGSPWFYQATRDISDKLWRKLIEEGKPATEAKAINKDVISTYYQYMLFDMLIAGQDKIASKEVQVRISSLTNIRQQNEVKKTAFMEGCREYIQNLPLKTLTNYIPLAELFKYTGVGEVPDLAKIFSLLDSNEVGCLKKVGEVIHFGDAAVDEVVEKRFLGSAQLRFSSGKLLYNSESVVFK